MVVIVGELHLVRYLPNGAVAVLQRSTGGFVAEASLDAPRYHCHILAAAPSRVLRIPLALFRSEMVSKRSIAKHIISSFDGEKSCDSSANEKRLRLESAAVGLRTTSESEGTRARLRVLSQTHKAWAAELGLSHETLCCDARRDGARRGVDRDVGTTTV